MNKPFKILSSTAMAAALATTALVPTAAAETPSEVPAPATQLAEVIFDDNGQLVSLDVMTYAQALAANAVDSKPTHVSAKDGSVYPVSLYVQALAAEKSPAKALEVLYKAGKSVDVNVVTGKIVDKKVVAENAPSVIKEGKLNIETVEEITADGVTTEVVKFQILNEEGKVDKTANDVVLEIGSTYGFLSQKRLTIQNGEGEVILRSEFLAKETEAKISAQVIEAKDSHKGLIGKLAGEKTIKFLPPGTSVDEVTVKQLVGANSNQADRVTLFFDKEVSLADFYQTNADGSLVLDGNGQPVLIKDVLQVGNKLDADKKNIVDPKDIAAVVINKDNLQSAEVILKRDNADLSANVLTDNTDVYIEFNSMNKKPSKDGFVYESTKTSEQTFKLADARQASVTGLKALDNRTLEVSFSEAIAEANFLIDAQYDEEYFDIEYKDVKFEDGRFINERRDTVIIQLNEDYNAWDKVNGYFEPGKHALEISTIKDFASLTDSKNIGKTQVLEFEIKEDGEVAVATQEVHSPEQFKVAFDKPVQFKEGNKTTKFEDSVQFQVWDPEAKNKQGDWVDVKDYTPLNGNTKEDLLSIKEVNPGVFKVEMTKDWTEVYNTKDTKENYYNDEFRLVLPKKSVLTVGNGNLNEEQIILPLTVINGNPTALATPDTDSPVIRDIVKAKDFTPENGKFIVEMSEPVKVEGLTKLPTLAQNQASLPKTLVEFQGKDADGKVRTFIGEIDKTVGFVDAWDTKFAINWVEQDGETPQTVVDAGGSTTWEVVVRSISDDVGNTAATVTKEFTLAKQVDPEGVFRVAPTGGDAVGADGKGSTYAVAGEYGDKIEITYTEAVAVTGLGSATNVKNYTLNGKDLPTAASIALKPGTDKKTVVITLPEKTLKETNVITLAKQIKSEKGKELAYDKTFTFTLGGKLASLIEEAKEANKDLNSKTLEDAIKEAEKVAADKNATKDEVTKAEKALQDALKAAKEEKAKLDAKNELDKLINENPATKFEDKKAAQDALDAAKAVSDKEDATADELKAAKKELEDKLGKLDPVVTELKLSEIEGSTLTYDALSESTIAVIPLNKLNKTMKDAFENGKLHAEYNGEKFIFEVVTNPEQPDAVLDGYNIQDKSKVKVVIKEN